MRQIQRTAVAFVAGLAALAASGAAQARPEGADPQQQQGAQQQGAQREQGTQQQGVQGAQQGTQPPEGQGENPYASQKRGLGAGISGHGTPFVLGPLEPRGMGVGLGQEPQGEAEAGKAAPAPVPQFWLADAALFATNAANTAQTIGNEQNLMVQAPGVLSNQAQFMIAATDRAISSLESLQSNAQAVNPTAVSGIRDAINELTAARAQEAQTLEAANTGTLGSAHESTVRSTYEHVQAAHRAMQGVARSYGVQVFALAPLRPFYGGRGLGAGIGPQKPKAPAEGGTKAPEKEKAPEGGTKPPEKAPEQPATPTPPPQP